MEANEYNTNTIQTQSEKKFDTFWMNSATMMLFFFFFFIATLKCFEFAIALIHVFSIATVAEAHAKMADKT